MPQEVINLRVKQLKDWLDNGYITLQQLQEIYNIGDDYVLSERSES